MDIDKVDYSRYYIKNKHTYTDDTSSHTIEYIAKGGSDDKKSSRHHSKKRMKGKKHRRLVGTLLLVGILVVMFGSVILISDSMKGGYLISSISAMIRGEGEIARKYYAVEVAVFDDLESARVYSNKMRKIKGAGYVVNDDGYRVIAMVYDSESDALSVAKSLKLDGAVAKVYNVDIRKIDYKKFPSDTRNVVKDTMPYTDKVIKGLYDISVLLADENIDENTAKMRISGISSKVHNVIAEFEANVDGNTSNVNIVKVKAHLVAIEAMLENLTKDTVKRPNLLSDIRYTTCLIAWSYHTLTDDIGLHN